MGTLRVLLEQFMLWREPFTCSDSQRSPRKSKRKMHVFDFQNGRLVMLP